MKSNTDPNELVTIEEAALLLRLCTKTVGIKIRSGKIPATRPAGFRHWRIRLVDIEELLRQGDTKKGGNTAPGAAVALEEG
jgi:excisionase family DNA binding protein